MKGNILITPKSYKAYKEKAHALLLENGYGIIENNFGRTMTEDELISHANENVVGMIIGVDPLSARVLDRFENLRAISKYGVGMDNIDLERAAELEIEVKNAVGTNNVSVAELAISLILTLSRKIPLMVTGVKNGGWGRAVGSEITGKTVGLIGGGQIGKEVAKRAAGLGMEVKIYDPYLNDDLFLQTYEIEQVDEIEKLLKVSDYVSLHVPATDQTKGMINKDTLKLMKSTAYLINTSRGELVNEEDLYHALVNKLIAGAAQDVFSSEPPQNGEKLLELDSFILTPHIGAFTNESIEKMVTVSTQNLIGMLSKEHIKKQA
jgi:phosphoglycerate dehydrogenase-like enzyme